MAENITVDPKDAEDNKIMAILAYFGILVLVPIFAAKESPFARYHANQGLLLIIASFVLGFAEWILIFILALISPTLALFASFIYIINIGIFVLMVIGIINAVKGEAKPLPLIGTLFTIIK